MSLLQDGFTHSAQANPDALAIAASDGDFSYSELNRLANRLAHALAARGLRSGDRLAIWHDKSARTVATMLAALRLGAAYVPIDPSSPVQRCQTILADIAPRLLATTTSRAATLDGPPPLFLLTDDDAQGGAPSSALDPPAINADSLAYVLYTSGSTGQPKGVCISHRNALAFVNWAARELRATAADRFSGHSPFHFDMSVLDLFVTFEVGASVFLVRDAISFSAAALVDFAVRQRLTVWYCVPSVLVLMIEHGGLLTQRDLALDTIAFGGEAFPTASLRRLWRSFPNLRLFNFFGPTETNACTFHQVTEGDFAEPLRPLPIGRPCAHYRMWAQRNDGGVAGEGEEGELMVAGPGVMLGYWREPAQGDRPYATGDWARPRADGGFDFLGRRDRQVKLRGHRIELAEIELVLTTHPSVLEAVVAVHGSGLTARCFAFVVPSTEKRPALLELKQHCADLLPRYMIIDRLRVLREMPRTATGKIDRRKLASLAEAPPGETRGNNTGS